MAKDIVLDLVNSINNGDFDEMKPFFGDFKTALNFIKKKGYIHLIDPFQVPDEDRNELIYYFLSEPDLRDGVFKKLLESLHDVKEENGQYYLILDSLDELAELFKSYSRDISPQDVAKGVLGEDYYEPYYETTNDVYSDVIEELTPENQNVLKNKILETLKGVEVEINGRASDEMELIASEQGHDEYIEVNSENIDRIFNDEDTMKYLLKYELDEIDSNLHSIHSQAYNDAYTSELSENVWDELYNFIDSDTKIESYKWGNKYRNKLKITNHIFDVINQWFSDYKNYTDDFDYQGSYIGIIKQLIDEMGTYEWLSFRIPDYPDYRRVEKNINEFFGDYI